MRAAAYPVFGAVVLFSFVGCGPVTTPMPPRLDAAGQKQIDDAWDQALTPINKYDNQGLLDLLVLTQAYQLGVDTLSFRSEKSFSGGKVVMEIRYDRSKPGEDRFTVTVLDKAGKILRVEPYRREQVESTFHALNLDLQQLRQKKADGSANPAELQRLKEIEDRTALVEAAIPKAVQDDGKLKE